MGTIIISCSIAGAMILLAALFTILIQHKPGVDQKAPRQRKMVFWILFVLNPILASILGMFVFRPDAQEDWQGHEDYMGMIWIGVGIGAILYIVVGFILAKMFKNGKIGNWF